MPVAERTTAAWLLAGVRGALQRWPAHAGHGVREDPCFVGSLGGEPPLLLLLLLPPRSGDALRVDEQGDDQREAADEQRPVSREAEPLVEGVREAGPPSRRRPR